MVDLRPSHRCDDLLAIWFLVLNGAICEPSMQLGGSFPLEAGSNRVVHGIYS